MKTFFGVCGLFAVVVALGGMYWWGWSGAQGWAQAVVPLVADQVRFGTGIVTGATFLYLAAAVTLMSMAFEGKLRTPVKCLGFGMLGLAIAFGGFVLLTVNGGLNGQGSLLWCAQIMFCFIAGSLFVVGSVLALAFSGWYTAERYLTHHRQLALSRGGWN